MPRLTFTKTFITCFTAATISFMPVANPNNYDINSLSGDIMIDGITSGGNYYIIANNDGYTAPVNEEVDLACDDMYHTKYIPDENGGIIRFETEKEKKEKYLKGKGQKPRQMCKVRQDKYQFYG